MRISTSNDLKHVYHILSEVRTKMIQRYGKDLSGKCIDASKLIYHSLISNGFNRCCIVDGYFVSPTTGNILDHSWVECEIYKTRFYLDVTADQFNDQLPLNKKFPQIVMDSNRPVELHPRAFEREESISGLSPMKGSENKKGEM